MPTKESLQQLADSVRSRRPISLGPRRTASPHEFYRYPGRFSPEFARSAIDAFTDPGDLVLDPFVGGGTTAVEAAVAGRHALVADINPLATFVTQVKTTPLSESNRELVRHWLDTISTSTKLNLPAPTYEHWRSAGYLRHLESRFTWRISKLIRLALAELPATDEIANRFCRCVLLRTGQWALDMSKRIPTVDEFRDALVTHGNGMLEVACRVPTEAIGNYHHPKVIDASLPGLSAHPYVRQAGPPHLIVTSPPYPGVHIAYHRWKLFSRKETPAPYWIANRQDSNGLSHYTMSARSERNFDKYFEKLYTAYADLSRISSSKTILIQIVGFSDIPRQMPRFLEVMCAAGFTEFHLPVDVLVAPDHRLWREVPGRRWWTQAHSRRDITARTAREVVLFHTRSKTRDHRL